MVFYYISSLTALHDPRVKVCLSRAYIVLMLKPTHLTSSRKDTHMNDASSILALSQVARFVCKERQRDRDRQRQTDGACVYACVWWGGSKACKLIFQL